MSRFLYESHWGSPTLTLLNVLSVLGVLNVLNVLNVLHVLNMPMDASLACWALFYLTFMLLSFQSQLAAIYSRNIIIWSAVPEDPSVFTYVLVRLYP